MAGQDKFVHVKRARAYNPAAFGRSFSEDQRNGNFNFDTIHGLKLKKVVYAVLSSEEHKARRKAFDGERDETGKLIKQGIRSDFLKMLANDHEKELVEKLGLLPNDIELMKKGYTPNGYNVHHKLPLHGGGKNEFKNFILTPKCPHDQWHWDVLDPQIAGIERGQKREVLLPWTDDMIYDPKKYGFTKENQPVKPNFKSNVNPALYDDNYTPEGATVENRRKSLEKYIAAQKAQNQQNGTPVRAALLAKRQRD